MTTIEYFMWGYQDFFTASAKRLALDIFNQVDPELKPKLFLIGLLEDNIPDRHSICIEPEQKDYPVSEFENIDTIAKTLRSVDKEGTLFQTHPVAQQNQDRRLTLKSYRQAILNILNRKNLYKDRSFFISYSAKLDGYRIFTVLELSKNALANHYSLTKTVFNERYTIRTSLLDSLIYEFLACCTESLYHPDPGADSMNRGADEIFRLTAEDFMRTVAQAGANYQSLGGLYNACNTISSLKYEGAEGIGKILIAPKGHKNIKMLLELAEPIKISDFRKVRKFLEITDSHSMIFSDAYEIYVLCEKKGKYNHKEESIFEINFSRHYSWELSHDGNPLMSVSFMQPSTPKERMDKAKFEGDILRIFNGIRAGDIEFIWELIESAVTQKHGTMLVISSEAKTEAVRLGKQGFRLNPVKLDGSFFNTITAIDGAVMIDTEGTCHAIGLILDGKASNKGDASRGARFNSAVRYLDTVKKPAMIVIISEDGMINFIPSLRAKIKRSTIIHAINEIMKIGIKKIDVQRYYELVDFFKASEFYLTKEECNIVNSETDRLNPAILEANKMLVEYDKLAPSGEMNNTYYIEE
ncbi:diadenylate cyclase [Pedobacter sp. GR22-10]|uniref:diadenylate cyclase n=1 Tax=Pedobacter sp. GR22-10 TaxID=2994472 RepID=UPI0022470599|nr:diadenylate cyclase [Pedobacter sp. GR22-10]MCX2432197.1 diadenylate cyclase [Pedobacter sp. GR22-10]